MAFLLGPIGEKHNRTALLSAIQHNKLLKVQELLNSGVPINKLIKFKDGDWLRCYSPLCVAVAYGNAQCVQVLLQNGAQVDRPSYCYRREYQEKFTPLFIACREGKLHIVSMLLGAGADINQSLTGARVTEEEGGSINYSDTRNRCLHWATMYRKIELLHTLLDCGANPLICNCQMETPLHLACDTYNPDFIQILVKAGGVAANRDMYGATPLNSLLIHKGDIVEQFALTRLMLAAGYNINSEQWFREFKALNGNWNHKDQTSDQTFIDVLIDKFGISFLHWLQQWSRMPHRLTYLCRGAVRRNIGPVYLVPKLQQLPLPLPLIQYLALESLDTI